MKINKDKINKIIVDPLDDSEIRDYLDPVKILKYSDLKNYKSIEELLPNDKSYIIILVEQSFNNGHWICISRFNNIIEYFDSYGLAPSQNLKWNDCELNKELGQGFKYLNYLFDNTKLNVIYNPIEYQGESSNINTCGRHCIFRILMMVANNMNLNKYYKFMKSIKDKYKKSYDEIVSYFIENIK